MACAWMRWRMLYLDYSRNHGEWEPNIHGGRENLDAIAFIKEFNDAVHTHHPDTITIAEESHGLARGHGATTSGGLGFDLKWMMGWMHDTLSISERARSTAAIIRASLHSASTMLSPKIRAAAFPRRGGVRQGSLINKMPGDEWQKFANLRLLYGYMWGIRVAR